MMFSKKYFLIGSIFCASLAHAQTVLPVATEMKHAYEKNTRNKSGAPGGAYWQNKADYDIKISFDPATRQLKGYVNIDYTNNSPDTLKRLLFKLYPNLYRKDAMRTMPVDEKDLGDGVQINQLAIDEKPIDNKDLAVRGTNLNVRKVQVMPGKQVRIKIDYAYTLNEHSFIRTGQVDSGAFFIAYFFPRVAVYDDIDGWNDYPYTGHDEFYNDYGQFTVAIEVPGDYQVWTTGDLTNSAEVYNAVIEKRIEQASKSDGITDIITAADLNTRNVTLHNKLNTWKFSASNVTDFAFGISNHYVWKSCSLVVDSLTGRRTRVDAVYNPADTAYLPVIDYARNTVKAISYNFPGVPFPYSHETIFDGLDAMEYPMMVNNLPFKELNQTVEFTTHEVFHSLFPFYVGTNETKHGFMDEGWATLTEFMLYDLIDTAGATEYDISDVNESAGSEQDVPIMTLSPQLYGKARYSNKDLKPALGYFYLKEFLGDALFTKALKAYIDQWQGKHPTPYDFFYCFNTAAGKNLNWFWKNWFFEKNIPDLAITKVDQLQQKYTMTITRVGDGTVPVHATVYYSNGKQQMISRNIGCWAGGNRSVKLVFKSTGKVKKIVLGSLYDADSNKSNNIWVP